MDKNTKNALSIFAFVVITLYSLVSNYWIMWAVITLMLFFDNVLDSLKDWYDKRQEIYLSALKSIHSPTSDNIDKQESVEQAISQIEKRLDRLEK